VKKTIIFIIAVVFSAAITSAAERSVTVKKNRDQHVEQRIALIIGNSTYKVSPLKNPANDAKVMARTLRDMGFIVDERTNLGRDDMMRAMDSFGKKIKDGGVGLFYYAGHGMQVNGENYLMAVDAVIESEDDVKYNAVEANYVLDKMKAAKNSMNIVILDACRNNPFARSMRSATQGLATMNAPSGTIIAYATAPGSVASDGRGVNGLYTQEFVRNVKKPGLKIEDVFKQVRGAVTKETAGKQVPWEASSLVGDFYFVESAVAGQTSGERQQEAMTGKQGNAKTMTPAVKFASREEPKEQAPEKQADEQEEQADSSLSGKVVEVIAAGGYSYVCIEKSGNKTWVAVPEMKVTVGQHIAFQPGQEMQQFVSKSLNRTFKRIIFSSGPAS